jgi:hypothetical protein
MKLLTLFGMAVLSLQAMFSGKAEAIERRANEEGLYSAALKSGERTIVEGVAVSCEAPPMEEGIYYFYCFKSADKMLPVEETLVISFIDKVSATYKQIKRIHDRHLINNDCMLNLPIGNRLYGPVDELSEELLSRSDGKKYKVIGPRSQ